MGLKGLCLHHSATNCLAWEALDLSESQYPHLQCGGGEGGAWGGEHLHLVGHQERARQWQSVDIHLLCLSPGCILLSATHVTALAATPALVICHWWMIGWITMVSRGLG